MLTYLAARGLTLVERNFRCRLGEIDLVMLHEQKLVFVEVRSRTSRRFTTAAASIDLRKQRKLARAAGFFLLRRPRLRHHPVRFDVVALDG